MKKLLIIVAALISFQVEANENLNPPIDITRPEQHWRIDLNALDFNIRDLSCTAGDPKRYFFIKNCSGGIGTAINSGGVAWSSERLDTGVQWNIHHALNDWTLRDNTPGVEANFITVYNGVGRIGIGRVYSGSVASPNAQIHMQGTTPGIPMFWLESTPGQTANLIQGSTAGLEDDLFKVTWEGAVDTGSEYRVNGVKVLGEQLNGWESPTGVATRTSFDTDTVTTQELAERLKALIDDMKTHGLIDQ